jgi:hypothetical protein
MSLVLEHIYGVQTSDRRNSIMYIHFSMNPDQLKNELEKAKKGYQEAEEENKLNPNLNMVMP